MLVVHSVAEVKSCMLLVDMGSSASDLLEMAMQANVAVVIAAFKDGLQSQGYDFAAAPDTPAARNINVVG
jgi:lipopolysaccharide biosynthesis protein